MNTMNTTMTLRRQLKLTWHGGKDHPGNARGMMGATNPRKSNLKSNRKHSGNVARLEFNTTQVNKKKNGKQDNVSKWGSDLISAPFEHTPYNPSMIGPDEMESWGIDSKPSTAHEEMDDWGVFQDDDTAHASNHLDLLNPDDPFAKNNGWSSIDEMDFW